MAATDDLKEEAPACGQHRRHRQPASLLPAENLLPSHDRWSRCWSTDAGLMLAIFAVPMAFGGRHSIGQFLLVVAAVWSALSWAVLQLKSPYPNWVRSRLEPLLLVIVGVGVLQIIPLPGAVTGLLSPHASEILPMWQSATIGEADAQRVTDESKRAADGVTPIGFEWPYLSLTVTETRAGLAVGMAYVLLFLVAVQRIRDVRDAGRMLRWIALSGGVMIVFGLVQYLFSNGRFFWFFEHPQATTAHRPVGGFLNKNHFSQFVALCLGPLVWWLMTRLESRDQRKTRSDWVSSSVPAIVPVVSLATLVALAFVAVLMARSRGGFLAIAAAAFVLVFGLYAKTLISKRQLGVMCGIGLTVCLLLGIVGHDRLTRIMDRLDNWSDNGRFPIWQANLEAISDAPIIGTGIGSHRYVYPQYLDQPFEDGEYSHAESSYLQILTETGLIGFSVCIVCVLMCFYWCCRGVKISRSRESSLVLCAATATLVATCVQSLGDFVWYIPGCMVIVVLMMACAFRVFQMERDRLAPPETDRLRTLSRIPLAAGAVCTLLLGLWMGSQWLPRVMAEPHWVAYRRVILAPVTGREVATDDGSGRLKQVIVAMRKAVKANPNDPRFHVRLAAQYTRLFHVLQKHAENSFPLNQLRDAAQTGGFESQEQMREWLDGAVGPHIQYAYAADQHVRRAIELNPLEARGYLYMSELAFLSGAPAGFDRECVAQALTLRPYDADILFAAGRDARIDQDIEQWIEFWKMAFHRDEVVQTRIIRQLAEWTPAPARIIAEAFEPDIPALERTAEILDGMQLAAERDLTLALLATQLFDRAGEPDNRNRSTDWLKAAEAYARLGKHDRVEECLQSAYSATPNNFVVRLEYGGWLLRNGQTIEAGRHLEWCHRMKPDHPKLSKLLSRLNRTSWPGGIRQTSATDADSGAELQ